MAGPRQIKAHYFKYYFTNVGSMTCKFNNLLFSLIILDIFL